MHHYHLKYSACTILVLFWIQATEEVHNVKNFKKVKILLIILTTLEFLFLFPALVIILYFSIHQIGFSKSKKFQIVSAALSDPKALLAFAIGLMLGLFVTMNVILSYILKVSRILRKTSFSTAAFTSYLKKVFLIWILCQWFLICN